MTTVRVARTADVATFNPLLYTDKGTGEVVERLFSHLVVTDSAGQYAFGEIVAEARKTRADGRTAYWLRLRDDAYWHDGRPVTAADVRRTLSLILDPAFGSPRRSALLDIGSELVVSADGPRAVRIEFGSAGAGIRALAWLPLIPAHRAGSYATRTAPVAGGRALVGSGEFRLGSHDPAAGTVTLQANAAHWNQPRIDVVQVRRFADSASALDSVLRGDSDIAPKVPPALAALARSSPRVRVHTSSEGSCVYLGLNTLRHPLGDRAVRVALAQAIDRRRLVEEVLAGHGLPARTLIHPDSEWHCRDVLAREHDARAASAALAAAGWRRSGSGTRVGPAGTALRLSLLTAAGDDLKLATARLISAQLAAVGVAVDVACVPIAELLTEHVATRRYDMVMLTLSPLPSPSFLRDFYHSGGPDGGGNRFGYRNRAVDALIDSMSMAARDATDAAWQVQRLVAQDVPHVPLFHPDVIDVAASWLALPPITGLVTNRFASLHQWDIARADTARRLP
ncbi:MAG TPA: ABC transporter substrate-binding protein [Trebonia sp.]|nr:ABC transporter substrate-binding protein [Trebonia sp.]